VPGPGSPPLFKDEITAIALDALPFEAEIPVPTANGTMNYFFLQLSPIQGHEKDYSRVHVMLIDITETKKAKHYCEAEIPSSLLEAHTTAEIVPPIE